MEQVIGSSVKRLEPNEQETVIVQRRSVRAARTLEAGTHLTRLDLEVLRPCPVDGIPPSRLSQVVGATLMRRLERGEHVRWKDLV